MEHDRVQTVQDCRDGSRAITAPRIARQSPHEKRIDQMQHPVQHPRCKWQIGLSDAGFDQYGE